MQKFTTGSDIQARLDKVAQNEDLWKKNQASTVVINSIMHTPMCTTGIVIPFNRDRDPFQLQFLERSRHKLKAFDNHSNFRHDGLMSSSIFFHHPSQANVSKYITAVGNGNHDLNIELVVLQVAPPVATPTATSPPSKGHGLVEDLTAKILKSFRFSQGDEDSGLKGSKAGNSGKFGFGNATSRFWIWGKDSD